MMSELCSSPLVDVVKTVEVAKVRNELILRARGAFEGASDIACPRVTVFVVDPPVVSSDRTDCDRIDCDGGASSSRCCCRGRESWDPNE